MCDRLDRNLPKSHLVIESNCLCHGRRHVVNEVENFPDECRHVLEELRKGFKNDNTCHKQKLSPEQRIEFHQESSGPIMDELEKWLKAQLEDERIEPNSRLGQAFRYLLKRWHKLRSFCACWSSAREQHLQARAQNGDPTPQQLALLPFRERRQLFLQCSDNYLCRAGASGRTASATSKRSRCSGFG
jgi:hypothetical protein